MAALVLTVFNLFSRQYDTNQHKQAHAQTTMGCSCRSVTALCSGSRLGLGYAWIVHSVRACEDALWPRCSPLCALVRVLLCSIKRNGLPDMTFYGDYGSVQKTHAPKASSAKAAKQ
jgi:hypothetical protein